MEVNMNRYGFSGKGNILIKAGTSGKFGIKTFEEGEPIAFFTDVDLALDFIVEEKVASSSINNYLANYETKASVLRVTNVKITDSLLSILYKAQQKAYKYKTESANVYSNDGILFLPVDGSHELDTDYIYVFNNKKEKIEIFTFDSANKSVSGLENGQYKVFYKVKYMDVSSFSLKYEGTPNMSLEVQIIGNINNSTGYNIIEFKRVKLATTPTMDFSAENPFVENLEFIILDEKEGVEVNYLG
jgi:hypothetical protein